MISDLFTEEHQLVSVFSFYKKGYSTGWQNVQTHLFCVHWTRNLMHRVTKHAKAVYSSWELQQISLEMADEKQTNHRTCKCEFIDLNS